MLFEPLSLGRIRLPNRIVMAPMTRCRASADHCATEMMASYYAQRASAGLIITEGTAPAPDGAGYARIPGLWADHQVAGWEAVTRAVRHAGGRIAVQLMHTGRVSHPANMPPGAEVLAPSAVPLDGEMYTDGSGNRPYPTPRAMDEGDIERAIEQYAASARLAIRAGFDLVEIHGANGYLVDQFLSVGVNQREDRWGGTIDGRGRFAVEVARRCADAIGADRVGIRLSPFGVFNGIRPWDTVEEDFVALAARLGELDLAYLHFVDHSAMGAPEVPSSVKARMREVFGGPAILCGGYYRMSAESALEAGAAELIAFGRPYIANPDLVERLRSGSQLNAPDSATFYTPGEAGYLDYSTLA